MNDWISVKDRLPMPDEEVLVYTPDSAAGDRQVAYRAARSGKWHDTRDFYLLEDQPTHWMPLPAPPENE